MTNLFDLRILLIALAGCVPILGCSDNPAEPEQPIAKTFRFNFRTDAEGWEAGFADYPAGEETFYELASGLSMLPTPLDDTQQSFRISGNNHSDDLFMFVKRQVDGLTPDTEYAIKFEVEFASNASLECVGVGGPPGSGVTVKAGATTAEPKPEDDGSGQYLMNVDKGNQSQGGADAFVLGNVGIDVPCDNAAYQLKALSNDDAPFMATSDAEGRLWLMVGTDSGFEATTTLYYTRIEADLEPK